MAKRVTVDLIDDSDGESIATETVSYGLDNVNYEIDLSSENAAKLRADLEAWTALGRRVGGAKRVRTVNRGPAGESGLPLAEIREWAQANGVKVAMRGRVSAEVVRAFYAAKPEAKTETKSETKTEAPAKPATRRGKAASATTTEDAKEPANA